MARDDKLELKGIITKALPGSKFIVTTDNDHKVMCTITGKLRMNKIRILEGDSVTIELSPYDLTKGFISWRH